MIILTADARFQAEKGLICITWSIWFAQLFNYLKWAENLFRNLTRSKDGWIIDKKGDFFLKTYFFLSVDPKNIKKPKFWPNLVILEFLKLLSGLYMLWLPGSQTSTKKNHAVKSNSKKSTFSKIFYKSCNYGDFWLVTSILASFWWVPSVYWVSLLYEIGKCLKTNVHR